MSLLLSLLLVFFALIFVFPLHLVFAGLFNGLSEGRLPPAFSHAINAPATDIRAMFVVYGVSFACMAGTLALPYRHGVRKGTQTNHRDMVALQLQAVWWSCFAAVGVLSILLALALPLNIGSVAGMPGFSYFLLAFLGPVPGRYRRRLERRLAP